MYSHLFLISILLLNGGFETSTISSSSASNTQESDSDETNVVTYDLALLTAIDNVRVSADDAGVIKVIPVKHGDQVEASQIIVQLKDDLQEAQLQAAEAEKDIADLEATNTVNIRFAEKSRDVNEQILERSRRARMQYADSVSLAQILELNLSFKPVSYTHLTLPTKA